MSDKLANGDKGRENDYYYLESDKNRTKIGLAILTIPIVIFSFNDYSLFGFSAQLYLLLSLRIILLSLTVALIFFLSKIRTLQEYERSITAFSATAVTILAYVFLTRPSIFIPAQTILACMYVLVFLVIIPNRILVQVAAAFVLAISGATAAIINANSIAINVTLTAIVGLFLAFAIGSTTSWLLKNYQGKILQEIASREKTEKALKESEELYRTLFDKTDDGFMLIEPLFNDAGQSIDIRFLRFNAAYERQTGSKAADAVGKRASEVVPQLDPEIISSSGEVAKTSKSLHLEVYDQYSSKWYESNYIPFAKCQVGILFRDITGRKKAEDSLAAKEKEYQQLVEQAPTAIYEIDFTGPRFKSVNDSMCIISGYSREELLALNPYTVLAPESREMFKQRIGRALAGEKIGENVEYKAITKDGRELWVILDMKLMSKNGRYYGAQVVAHDITELKKTQDNLRAEKDRYRNLADSLPEIVFETDLNGRVVFANKRGFEITGYTREDLEKGMDVFKLIAAKDLQKSIEHFRKTLKGQPSLDNEFTIARKDGSTFPAIILTNIIVENLSPAGLRGFVIDITERKKAEEALKSSEERYHQLFSSMTEMFFVAQLVYNDAEQVVDFVYCDANPALLKSMQKEREQVVGKKTSEVLGSIEGYWLEEFDRIEKTGQPVHSEEKSGLPGRYYDVYAWKTSSNQVAVIFEDITQRKVLEKQSQDNERLAAIGQTAGMVGHDIRNPLQAVMSDTYLLKDELASMPEGESKEGIAESIDSIERNTAYINKIVQDLQDYTRQIMPEYSVVDLSDVFVHTFETINVPESIRLSVNVRDAEKIRIDPTLLQRAISNLINNAIQAMPEGGKLEVCGEKKDNKIVVTVSDTGVGIPDEVKPKLFTPMMTTKAKGQGFGLAASKRIIEAMSGTISFESEKGKGTKFIIELPSKQ